MNDVSSAVDQIRDIEHALGATGIEVERLTRSKRDHALAAARGDRKAERAVASANAGIVAAEQRRADLGLALEAAHRELDDAKRREQTARDADLGGLLEERVAELSADRGVVDRAMRELATALRAHGNTTQRLLAALPREPESLGYALRNDTLLIRMALEFHGLTVPLGLPSGTSAGKPIAEHSLASITNFAAGLRHALAQAA